MGSDPRILICYNIKGQEGSEVISPHHYHPTNGVRPSDSNEKVCNLRSVVNANVNLSAELKLWGWGVSVSQDVFKGERALTDVVLQSPLRLLEK